MKETAHVRANSIIDQNDFNSNINQNNFQDFSDQNIKKINPREKMRNFMLETAEVRKNMIRIFFTNFF